MIRLKALDLVGFKSFADRTRFEFPDGITVVVGPNGSGKSNVVDAIKWVLGEQSMRSLRGRNATDVIFAGSASRKPLNVAEVALIFDNSARELPVELDEVQIARRVYRSGESEYLVNGEISRLRDIRELFSGTGAATEAYSVIEQGRVDALLVASGRDRRIVFEEAAGITRFRARRGEALRRLERAEQNRQRLADIVGEVVSRLETVTLQAKRARRWRTMTDTLRAFRVAAATQDLTSADATMATVATAVEDARTVHAAAEARATAAMIRIEELSVRERDLLPRLEEQQHITTHECERAAAAEARLSLLQSRSRELTEELFRCEADLQSAQHDTRAVNEQIMAAREALDDVLAEADRIMALVQSQEEVVVGSHQDATLLRRRLDERADTLSALQQARIEVQAACDREAARAAEAGRAIDAWRSRIDAARRQLARGQEAAATWEGNLATLTRGLDRIALEMESLEATQRHLAVKLDEAWQSLASCTAKLEACGERRAVLEEMIGRHEGLSDAARRLLAAGGHIPGLAGAVADLVVADEPWATLVDLALGAHSQSLVVEALDPLFTGATPWAAGAEIRDALTAGGRVAFLAASSLREPPPFEPTGTGMIGRLDRLIAATSSAGDTGDETLRTKLLGRIWVVESLDHAAPLAATAPEGIVFITRDGASLSASGVYEMGSLGSSLALVSRRSEWRALDERHSELTRAVARQKDAVDSLQKELADVQQQIRHTLARKQQAGEQIAASRAELGRAAREQESARATLAEAEAGLHEAERQAVDLAHAGAVMNAALADHDIRIHNAQAAVTAARGALDALDRSRHDVAETIHRLRAERAACETRIKEARAAVEVTIGNAAIRRADVEAAIRRRAATETRLKSVELDLLTATAAYAEVMVSAERARDVLLTITADRVAVAAAIDTEDAEITRTRAELSAVGERIHRLDLEAGEARHARSRIIERIRDDYQIVIEGEAPPEPVIDADGAAIEIPAVRGELDQRIDELRRKLASMTTVNMEALAEADALTERLKTLEAQLADVTDGKQAIEQLIARIDDESRRLLGETIETVRGHFRELFERVFGGGQADIVLEPDVDLLETSVEIVARPPGKEPRSISLLSGGEKTMTCVALLLAIFRSRPSPFCVLDEVDAALDEANVDRFVGVLRDFLSSTQFIVVTHSKKTMAAGTTLYGVTMEESGVSKRVSVRLESTAAGAGKIRSKAA
jgi:chromosome segregation protein